MKIKRMLGVLLAFLVALAMLPKAAVATADAEGGANGESVTWSLDGSGMLYISGTGPMADYSGGTQPWWNDRERISDIIIADGVTRIGSQAFNTCIGISSMTIPKSVKSIGTAAFAGCVILESVDLGSVESIGDSAFATCFRLESVTIPSSVTKIGSGAFAACDNLEHLFVDNSEAKVETEDRWSGEATVHWRHTVTAAASPDAGGTVSISPTSDSGTYWDIDPATLQPTTITVTTEPKPGYFLEKLTYKAKDSAEETDITETKAFDMPNADVTVTATFKPKSKLTITAYDQTYEFNGETQGEGDTIYEDPAEIAAKVRVEGLQDGDALTSIALDGQGRDVGEYPIVPSNAAIGKDGKDNDKYEIECVNGTLRIANKYTVAVEANPKAGGTVTGEGRYFAGAEVILTATPVTGYRFVRWESDEVPEVDGAAETEVSFAMPAGDVTAIAVFEEAPVPAPKKATLTFDLAGGTMDGKTGKVTVEASVGDTITIPGPPTRKGYSFRYWRGSRYNPGDSYAVAGDHSFTAVWKKVSAPGSHTVTFDANGHGTAPAAQTVKKGKAATKPADPNAEGWTFGGWFLNSSCTRAYDFSKPVTSDITLYAKWTKRSATTTTTTTASVLPQTGDPAAAVAALPVLGASLALAGLALRRRKS